MDLLPLSLFHNLFIGNAYVFVLLTSLYSGYIFSQATCRLPPLENFTGERADTLCLKHSAPTLAMPLFDSENEHSDPDRDSFPVDHNEDSVDDEHEEPYEVRCNTSRNALRFRVRNASKRCLQGFLKLSKPPTKAACAA